MIAYASGSLYTVASRIIDDSAFLRRDKDRQDDPQITDSN